MATSQNDIREWLQRGKDQGATHMVVVCDTFDWEDFPVYVMPGNNVRKVAEQYNGPNMTKLMEVYSINKPWDPQINTPRAFEYD